MKNIIRTAILASAVVATVALASTSAMAATLKVPFTFMVGGKQCPAGTYTVQRGINSGVVTISDENGTRNFTWVLRPGDPAPGDKAVVMRFGAEGQTHVLETVQYGSQVAKAWGGKSTRTEHPTISISAGEGR